jgi:hypothetical protein
MVRDRETFVPASHVGNTGSIRVGTNILSYSSFPARCVARKDKGERLKDETPFN